jgi:DNA-binding transcriptional LysR family regulator
MANRQTVLRIETMTLDLEVVRAFLKVAELASFTRAAEQLGLSKSQASLRVQALEHELGTQLLTRSTRTVRVTPDGEQFLLRARRLLTDADDLGTMFQAPRTLRGIVRMDLPISIARDNIIPRLPELLALHPQLTLLLSATDRRVDLLRDGLDCVLRIGHLADSGLVARRLGSFAMVNCASPSYLSKYGVPRTLADLDDHLLVNYSLRLGLSTASFEYHEAGGYVERPMRSLITVNNTDAYHAACRAGLGIIQAPRLGLRAALAAGELVEVLPDLGSEPMPVSIVHTRNVPKRVREVMSWLARQLAPHLLPLQ